MAFANFKQQMRRAIDNVDLQTSQSIRKIIFECFSGVVLMSPVDTGRFRGNWRPGLGSYPEGTVDTVDWSGGKTIAEIDREIESMPIDGRPIFLVNNLPYAQRLEYEGYSNQAPNGMVRVTLSRIAAKYGA